MRTKTEILQRLTDPGIIAVIRARRASQVVPLSRALMAGGVRAIEVTMTTPDALEAIQAAVTELGPEAVVGVGTVLDEVTCTAAIEAGAEFVVSPIAQASLVPIAHAAGRPVMLGAYTPTEAQRVHEAGADFVKLFPADNLGPAYVKALRAPLPHLRIVPTGGVDEQTLGAFLQAGCAAVGAGSSLVPAQVLADENWEELTRRAQRFCAAAASARAAMKQT